jgi:hypothetical protein
MIFKDFMKVHYAPPGVYSSCGGNGYKDGLLRWEVLWKV